jgi:hypothetical protein
LFVSGETDGLVGAAESFAASIGNGLDGYFTVTLVEPGVFAWVDSTSVSGEVVERVAPSVAGWEAFARVVERLEVFGWLSSYEDRSVLDGSYWSLSCRWAGRTVDSSGGNAYPPGFDEFCRAVEQLLGGRSFR